MNSTSNAVNVIANHDKPRMNCGSPRANVSADNGQPISDPTSSTQAKRTRAAGDMRHVYPSPPPAYPEPSVTVHDSSQICHVVRQLDP